jgi:hypothetical protein
MAYNDGIVGTEKTLGMINKRAEQGGKRFAAQN